MSRVIFSSLSLILVILFSCSSGEDEIKSNVSESQLLSVTFLSSDNPENLIEDVKGEILGDSICICWAHHLMDNKNLYVKIDGIGGEIFVNGEIYDRNKKYNLSTPALISIKSDIDNIAKDYKLYFHSFTGLPVLFIDTENRQPIISKDEYLRAHMKLQEDIAMEGEFSVKEADLSIKGRGNSTWIYPPKKPYRLKLDEKMSLLGEAKDKSWVLLANYYDNTMLRNTVAFYLGSISNLPWTPKSHYVELMLNGRFQGTYQLTEKIKVSKNRVNVGDEGYLLEIDNKLDAGEVWFSTPHLPRPVRIHEPEVVEGDNNYNEIKNFFLKAEEALFSDNFLNTESGYGKYIDKISFVDWYLISEIIENASAPVNWYMSLSRGGKLTFGPLWDYDLSSGNVQGEEQANPYIFHLKDVEWFARLMTDTEVKTMMKERYAFFYSKRNDILNEINRNAQLLHYSIEENNNRWNRLYTAPWTDMPSNLNFYGSYLNEVYTLKKRIIDRMEWLNNSIASL